MDAEVLEAITTGNAFVDLSSWRKISVAGSDAFQWLNDLVSVDLSGMRPGDARRSLLLSPTGRVQAEFTVTTPGDAFLLIQDPEQPRGVDDLLSKYVLSSDVSLEDRSGDLALFALPQRPLAPGAVPATVSSPSCVGDGVDTLAPMRNHDDLVTFFDEGLLRPLSREDLETWRVFAGVPRFGVDVTEDDLPQEAGLEGAVSFGKGCYLGQEAVAKVRNLGHPRRVLLHVEAAASLAPEEAVCADSTEVGKVTSAVRVNDLTRAFAKVRWDARDEALSTSQGATLRRVGEAAVHGQSSIGP